MTNRKYSPESQKSKVKRTTKSRIYSEEDEEVEENRVSEATVLFSETSPMHFLCRTLKNVTYH